MNIPRPILSAIPAILLAFPSHGRGGPLRADFAYAPAEWQSTICLPDDPWKTLVNEQGVLCYDFRGGHRQGRDFNTYLRFVVDPAARWVRQELFSPRVPIVRTIRRSRELEITEEVFAFVDPADRIARGDRTGFLRQDAMLVSITNRGKESRTLRPRLIVDHHLDTESSDPATGLESIHDRFVRINGGDAVRSTSPLASLHLEKHEDHVEAIMNVEPIELEAGRTTRLAFVYRHPGDGSSPSLEAILEGRKRAVEFWENSALPYDRVVVPDPTIQALLDASIRNIWQAREIKQGLPAFQVGPTVYRGLWIVDGAFLLETATLLGAGEQARAGLRYMLSFQKEDGSFEIIRKYWKENGIVLWACVRHALLTQDRNWLRSVWPKLEKTVAAIEHLRQQTYRNDTPLDDGLMPPGFPDGGLAPYRPEYSNVYWNLAGLKAAIQGALWLGDDDRAARWRETFDSLYRSFTQAAERDRLRDAEGNLYVPNYMGAEGRRLLPQRAQWAFCHAVYPGQVFAPDDPLVASTLAMLAATEREGMVYGTGWNRSGLWNYFASFYGHAWLWQGRGRKAAEVLYAFANHASPLFAWREEQNLKTDPYHRVGDMPHNWASAEFIRLTVHLLEIDRGNELHLLEGFPREWAQPGMSTRLRGIQTPFGSLGFSLSVNEDGTRALLRTEPLSGTNCERLIVHLGGWASEDPEAYLTLAPGEAHEHHIPIDSFIRRAPATSTP